MSRRKGFRLFEQNSTKTLNEKERMEEIIFQAYVEKYAGKRGHPHTREDFTETEEEQNY